jgi:hypothetical protein
MTKHQPHSSRLAAISFAVACVCGHAVAQDLGMRLLDAVRGDDYYQAALTAAGAEATARQLLDALVPVHELLQDHHWSRLATFLAPRHDELVQAFVDQPERRAARAPVFGRLPLGWVQRYVVANGDERAAIEQLVPWFPAYSQELDEHLRRPDASGAQSVQPLQRAWVRALHRRSTWAIAALRRMQGSESEAYETATAIVKFSGSPFSLQPLLQDPDRLVRARASIALRRQLGLAVSTQLADLLGEDAFAQRGVGAGLPPRPCTDAQLAALCAALEAGEQPVLSIGTGGSAPERERLGRSLLAALRPPSARAAALTPWQFAALNLALHLDPRSLVQLLQDAQGGPDAPRAEWLLVTAAVLAGAMPLDVAREMAPLLPPLLAAKNPATALAVAQLAAVALSAGDLPDLRAAVTARAVAAIGKLATMQMGRFTEVPCDGRVPRRGLPEDVEAILMLAALRAGASELRAPWLDALTAARSAADRGRREAHEHFLLFGLAEVAPDLDAPHADRAWLLLTSTPSIFTAIAAPAPQQLEELSLVGLLGSVSAPQVPAVVKRLLETPYSAHFVAQRVGRLPAERLRRYLEVAGIDDHSCTLHRAAPDLLTAAWADGGERAQHAAGAIASIADWTWVTEQLAVGTLTVPLVAAGLARWHGMPSPPLALLAACRDEAVLTPHLPQSLQCFPMHADDLPHWQALTRAMAPQVAMAACRRLEELGEPARPALEQALRAIFRSDAPPALRGEALATAVELGFQVEDLAALLASVTATEDPVAQAHALAVRLRAERLPLVQLPRDRAFAAMVLAGHEFTPADRAWLGDACSESALGQLAWQARPRTFARLLDAAAVLPCWSREFERVICFATDHELAFVRAAAYRALASRDPELWACAGLVAGAAFDADPLVRAVAEKPR